MDALNDCQRKSDTCSGTPIDVLEQDILDASPFLLDLLLQDKTTGKNIVWATDDYVANGSAYAPEKEILPALITGANTKIIQPRIAKNKEAQRNRTRKSAEVFTPSWICCLMNNLCDAEWFGRENVFNTMNGHDWTPTAEPVAFEPDGCKTPPWTRYVDSRRMEITCGEAPYLVSRYDATTGEPLPVEKRIGVLDRKLRVVSENTANETDWFFWARRAFESTYGYEYQGDNLLLARENLLCTFADYHVAKFGKPAPLTQLKQIANIIAWNVWQMDGLKDCVPFGDSADFFQFDLFGNNDFSATPPCKIRDWRGQKTIKFTDLKGTKAMKFDFVIGNPPYQDETIGDNKGFAPPVYHHFLKESYKIAHSVEMIHPARFLFNAGSTPKQWNEQMLNDPHLKVVFYEQKSSNFFPDTDIKGGVVVTYHDTRKNFGAIETFTSFEQLNHLLKKILTHKDFKSLSDIVVTRTAYRLTEKMHRDHPEAVSQLSNGHAYDMSTNIFERLPQIFFDQKPEDGFDYIKILGRENNERTYKYIRRDYVNNVKNLDKYKVILPKSNGSGAIGEVLSTPLIGNPLIGNTESFISIGAFDCLEEANAAFKYVKSKFARCALGILKTTQDNPPEKWKYVPLQDFTDKSDIDWSKSEREIDQQLYAKYGLSDDEIAFIEKNVKEMA